MNFRPTIACDLSFTFAAEQLLSACLRIVRHARGVINPAVGSLVAFDVAAPGWLNTHGPGLLMMGRSR